MTKIVTHKNQHPKPCRPINTKQNDASSRGDIRFLKYADALRAGNIDECIKLRTEWSNEREIITKFNTLERLWLSEMTHYIKEIQISRRERDGYKKLVEGYEKKLNGDKSVPNANTLIKWGRDIIAQAEEARLTHIEVEVPLLFESVQHNS
jgi:hypothetical protein